MMTHAAIMGDSQRDGEWKLQQLSVGKPDTYNTNGM